MLIMEYKGFSSRDEIKIVARYLLKKGIRPSQNNVKKELSQTSSNTTISQALDEFWLDVSKELESNDTRPGIPDELYEMVQKLWVMSLESANKIAQDRMDEALKVESNALEREAKTQEEIAKVSLKNERLVGEIDNMTALLEKEKASSADLGSRLVMSQESVRDIQAQLQETMKSNEVYRTEANQRVDSLMSERTQLRSWYEARETQLKVELDQSVKECRALNESLTNYMVRTSQLEKFKDLHEYEMSENKKLIAQQEKLTDQVEMLNDQLQDMKEKVDIQRKDFEQQLQQQQKLLSDKTQEIAVREERHLVEIKEQQISIEQLKLEHLTSCQKLKIKHELLNAEISQLKSSMKKTSQK
ncbi:DNA-binding protein [Amphritea opalescens]|uniref:DNA-binding protein n=2 Tax=Amphritea opalescens TaxID=2490544 RepID=A0A430KV24_9GAMM|nr:DNA-binding protein [Amphritea opalescens]